MSTVTQPQQFTAKLKDKVQLNDYYWMHSFEVVEPHILEFKAGQYVSIKVSDKGERRSYSISSSPAVQHGFDLLVDHQPNGLGCQYIANLQFGEEIAVLAPLGIFTVHDGDAEDELVFIATGSGIAPFLSMVYDQLQVKKDTRPITLYWGMRHETDLCLMEDLQNMAETFNNFSIYPVLSQATNAWTLSRGRVTDMMRVHEFSEHAGYYLCGSEAMIADVKKVLETEKNVSEAQIHHEKFF